MDIANNNDDKMAGAKSLEMFSINTVAEHYKKMRMAEYNAYQVYI